jgi:meiotically up-regulated gene 157 (Mug157) protein
VRSGSETLPIRYISPFSLFLARLCTSSFQFAAFYPLLGQDPGLQTLVKAVINNEARYVSQYPYCGSFQPPPESGLAPSVNDWAIGVTVNPPVNNQTVFECKVSISRCAITSQV